MKLVVSTDLEAVKVANPGASFFDMPADAQLAHRAAWTQSTDALVLSEQSDCFELAPENARVAVKLALFDMDSTLIPHECIDELARVAGVVDQVSDITERSMAGELDFAESFKARMALLNGLPESALETVKASISLMPGGEALMAEARARGVKTLLVSGGFNYFAEDVAARLGMDEFHANPLDIENGALTGQVRGRILDATRKAEILSDVAQELGLERNQIMATGDGANDLKMIALAGKGVAYHAKPKVVEAAPLAVKNLDLSALIWLWRWADAF